jgi:hypothetical protein
MAQLVQIAERIQTPVDLLAHLSLSAGAGQDLSEILMPDWNVSAQITQTPAIWTFGITKQIGLIGWCTIFSVR